MPEVVTISYIERARGLLWSEEIGEGQLGEKLLEAEANGETERAEAIEAAIAKALVPFRLRVDRWKQAAARVRVMR